MIGYLHEYSYQSTPLIRLRRYMLYESSPGKVQTVLYSDDVLEWFWTATPARIAGLRNDINRLSGKSGTNGQIERTRTKDITLYQI